MDREVDLAFPQAKDYLSRDSFKEGLMSDIKDAILDAAELRMQRGGFGGFSFREIATDVGVKSSSIHYHFPTKDDLATAVVRRWGERALANAEKASKKEADPVRVWTGLFRGTAHSKAHMCPCTVLGAAAQDLPAQVSAEVKRFFKTVQDKMIEDGLSQSDAAKLLSTITGALVLANALGDKSEYDRATSHIVPERELASP
jgi:TetR/AcrR family transcriptional repressor of nem operon